MDMKIKVRGFRGVEKADVEINPICLIAGQNYAGKSSVCQAIAAAATGQPIPFFRSSRPDKPMLTKTDAKELTRGGMESGMVTLEVDGTPVSAVTWPTLGVSGNGATHSTLVAAGLISPLEMDDTDRQRFFAGLLNATPTLSDLAETLKEAIPILKEPENQDAVLNILNMVKTNGWDVAHKHFKEQGAKRKGAWEMHAGEAFGARKAAGWKPAGWRAELDSKTLEELGTEATKAQEIVEAAIAAVATDAAVLAQLSEDAEKEAIAIQGLEEAEATLKNAKEHLAGLERALDAIRIPSSIPCPHCGGLLDVANKGISFTLKEASATLEDIAIATEARAKAKAARDAFQPIYEVHREVYDKARAAHRAVEGSGAKLKAAQGRTGTAEAVDVARDLLRGILADKEMVERRDNCEMLAEQVKSNQIVVDILAPEGLRRQKLQRALGRFNKDFLGALSAAAEFSTVTIDDDLEILYGGRRYFLLSASEQYRVRAVVQIATALYDKSQLVIFDGVDILDRDGRNGLFAMMAATPNLRFVVGMTILTRENVPDLAAAGMGASYWMNEGICGALSDG